MSRSKAPGSPEALWQAQVQVPGMSLVVFTRQFSSMLSSGVPLAQALDTLSHQPEQPDFGEVIRTLGIKISTGFTLSAALTSFPRIFPRIYVTMVQIGEQTGALDRSLQQLAVWQESDHQLRQRVRSALTYPVFVLAVAVLLTLGLFYYVLPGFLGIFQGLNLELPWITRVVMAVTQAVRSPGAWMVFLAVAGVGGTFLHEHLAKPEGAALAFRVALAIPLLGGILRCATAARYCGACQALIGAGLDLIRTIRLAGAASGNPLISNDVEPFVAAISEGIHASQHMLSRPGVYPTAMVQMVIAGEQASALPAMFARAATYYDIEMNYQLEAFSAALEPLMLAGVASVVATIVLSVFLPLYSYMGRLG